MSGKGDRPRKVDRTKFETNWDLIFNKLDEVDYFHHDWDDTSPRREVTSINDQMSEAHAILDSEEISLDNIAE